MNSLNSIKIIDPPEDSGLVKQQRTLFSAITTRTQFPNIQDLKEQMSKPEDQGSTESCVSWSVTTFIETLLWKLTGEKEEFTDDEVYNIFLDTHQYYTWNLPSTTFSFKDITALERKQMRSEDGKWTIPDQYNTGLYHYNFSFQMSMNYSSGQKIYAFYWICNYNNPEVRKNHYPDKYSRICEKAKNYIYNNIFQLNGDLYSTDNYYYSNPIDIKSRMNLFGLPIIGDLAGIDYSGNTVGHEAVIYKYDQTSITLDSSWDSEEIYDIDLEYESDLPYYTGTSDYRLRRIEQIEFYNNANGASGQNKVTVLSSDFGHIYGIQNGDSYNYNGTLNIFAIPNYGYYFAGISTSYSPDISYSNPLSIKISDDIEIIPFFSQSEDKGIYDVYINNNLSCTIAGSESGKYPGGSTIQVQVTPNDGYSFVSWSDGEITQARSIVVHDNIYLNPIIQKST